MQTKLRHALRTLTLLSLTSLTLNCGEPPDYQSELMEISEDAFTDASTDVFTDAPKAHMAKRPLDAAMDDDERSSSATPLRPYKQPPYGRLHEYPSLPIGYPQLLLAPHAVPLNLPDPNHVYAAIDEPLDANAPVQGYNGDCWFSATIAALAYRHPMAIKDAIHDTEDPNLWQVRLYELTTRRPVYLYVRKEYFTQEPLANRVVNNIKWPCILQNAFVQYNDATGHINAKARGYAALRSNNPTTAFKLLMNSGSWAEYTSKYKTDDAMRGRLGSGYPLAITTYAPPADLKLVAHHAYTVLDVDPIANKATFRNPWGTGGVDGRGTIVLSLPDTRRAFDLIYFSWPP